MKKHRYILIIILSLILLSATLYLLIQPSIVPAVAVEQVAPKPDVSILKGSLIERMFCTVSTILPL